LGYGFLVGLGLLLVSPPAEGSSLQRDQSRWRKTDILRVVLLGLGVGFGFGLQAFILGREHAIVSGCGTWIATSFVVVLGFILGKGFPLRLGWPRWSGTDTNMTLLIGLLIGPVSGIVVGLVVGFQYGLTYGLGYGLEYGLASGFIVGIGYTLVIVVNRWPARRGQRQWNGTDLTTLLIGLCIGLVSVPGYGITYI